MGLAGCAAWRCARPCPAWRGPSARGRAPARPRRPRPSAPSAACPTTLMSSVDSSSWAIPARTSGWSSTMRTRITAWAPRRASTVPRPGRLQICRLPAGVRRAGRRARAGRSARPPRPPPGRSRGRRRSPAPTPRPRPRSAHTTDAARAARGRRRCAGPPAPPGTAARRPRRAPRSPSLTSSSVGSPRAVVGVREVAQRGRQALLREVRRIDLDQQAAQRADALAGALRAEPQLRPRCAGRPRRRAGGRGGHARARPR